MSNDSVSLLFAKLNRRAPCFTRYDEKGLLITEWQLNNVKRYDFDCYLLDHAWQILPTLKDGSDFGIWVNPSAYCILHYDHGKTSIAQCNKPDLFDAELDSIRVSDINLSSQLPSTTFAKRQFA